MRLSWLFVAAVTAVLVAPELAEAAELDWWETALVYQIYPRSFQDSDGDGVGDLKGITSRLGYLRSMGFLVVWLSPIFVSPMADFGYDISDFYNIDPLFGTMDDFDELIIAANAQGIKIILDYVPNHSSDESDWFIRSVANETEFQDFYVWRDPVGYNDSGSPIPPNQWIGSFSEPVWTFVEERAQFYYHIYNVKQPDFNYRNGRVREEMKNVMTFWLDKGAHGFRVDTVHTLVEDQSYPNVPDGEKDPYIANLPMTYEIVQEWRALLDEYSLRDNVTRILMTEAYGSTDQVMAYYGNATHPGAHFTFNFNFILRLNNVSSAQDFVSTINQWMDNMPEGSTANWVIGNHDQHRVATRYGTDLAAGMAMLTLLLPGVGVVYNGEEIGMVNNWNISYEETQDPQGVNAGPDDYLARSRDFERTPFQWDDTVNAGFSNGALTWLPIHENYLELNLVKQQMTFNVPTYYNIYRNLVNARMHFDSVRLGDLSTYMINNDVVAIARTSNASFSVIVVVNLGIQSHTIRLNETIPDLPDIIYVYTANEASGYNTFQILSPGDVLLTPHASVVLTTYLWPISSAVANKNVFILTLSALIVVFLQAIKR